MRLEEGPKQGKIQEFVPKMLASTKEGSATDVAAKAAPAGTSSTDQERAERKSKAEEMAATLFGSLPKL